MINKIPVVSSSCAFFPQGLLMGKRKMWLSSLFSLFQQLLSGKRLVEGYHIQVRDWSSSDLHYDVVDISGGATRSHTLSDLRPNTRYSVFILPYSKKHIRGRPSNMKIVKTKEDGKCWWCWTFKSNNHSTYQKGLTSFLFTLLCCWMEEVCNLIFWVYWISFLLCPFREGTFTSLSSCHVIRFWKMSDIFQLGVDYWFVVTSVSKKVSPFKICSLEHNLWNGSFLFCCWKSWEIDWWVPTE